MNLTTAKYTTFIITLLILCAYFPHVMAWLSTGISGLIGWLLFTTKEHSKAQAKAIENHIHKAIEIHDKLAHMEILMNYKIEKARQEARDEAISKLDGEWK